MIFSSLILPLCLFNNAEPSTRNLLRTEYILIVHTPGVSPLTTAQLDKKRLLQRNSLLQQHGHNSSIYSTTNNPLGLTGLEYSNQSKRKTRFCLPARLIRMRIRFRASDFGQIEKKQTSFVQIETGFLCEIRSRTRRWCSGHVFVCSSCDSAVRFLDSENSSQRRLLLCLTPCRADFDRPWPQASKPALTDSSLAAKRRGEALHVVIF